MSVASNPDYSARTPSKEPTTDGPGSPLVKGGLEKVTVKVPSPYQCLCNFYLGQVLVGNLVEVVNPETWT